MKRAEAVMASVDEVSANRLDDLLEINLPVLLYALCKFGGAGVRSELNAKVFENAINDVSIVSAGPSKVKWNLAAR